VHVILNYWGTTCTKLRLLLLYQLFLKHIHIRKTVVHMKYSIETIENLWICYQHSRLYSKFRTFINAYFYLRSILTRIFNGDDNHSCYQYTSSNVVQLSISLLFKISALNSCLIRWLVTKDNLYILYGLSYEISFISVHHCKTITDDLPSQIGPLSVDFTCLNVWHWIQPSWFMRSSWRTTNNTLISVQ
jgi:hypothetical protein